MQEIYLVDVDGTWEEMTLNEMLEYAQDGADIRDCERRIYTGVDDINGNKIFDSDIVVEYGHYVNSDRTITFPINWKPNHAAWLRGKYNRLTPKNVKLYNITVQRSE